MESEQIALTPDQRYFPLVGKFALFAVLASVFLVGTFFLLINKDLDWLSNVGQTIAMAQAQKAVLGEFLFVGGGFLYICWW
ncbi:hypothetical protein BOW51_08780 [Solemya velesiana gill symbiont]|uniref:Cyclic di-GMP phosphodiesterase VC-1295-like MASE10 domain-containing protein n=1 Tax=Solemya velesiana gill symbiont TaxID=1918948 RepID=A0A1T2KTS7_9GAMM|nr:hypothetical protein BOW51_08780 [Solemya velesiana gill symbiont]